MPRRTFRARPVAVFTSLVVLAAAAPAIAQNYDLDARNVGMGAIGSTRNIADEHIAERRTYHRIGLPFGLIHVIQNRDVFKYEDTKPRAFDLVRALEYARNPFHLTTNQDQTHTDKAMIDDIIDKTLKRDLRFYRPFNPVETYQVEGVGFPNWGMTLKTRRNKTLPPPTKEEKKDNNGDDPRDADGYQGVYIGVGPYLTVTTVTKVDPTFSHVLGDPSAALPTNTSMPITHDTEGQAAIALVFGYRLYIPHHTSGPRREGMYVYVNYSQLYGRYYGKVNSTIRFDTDQTGLLALHPVAPPIDVNWINAKKGTGRVVDIGVATTVDRWDFGMGINGIGNRIDWSDFTPKRTQLANFFDGSEMEEVTAPPVIEPVRITVPLNVSTNLSYTADRWSVATEYARRFDFNNMQNGFEFRTHRVELRGGLRYARDRWHPAAGVGVNLASHLAFDAALFSTSTNVERVRNVAFAFSLRIDSKPKAGQQQF